MKNLRRPEECNLMIRFCVLCNKNLHGYWIRVIIETINFSRVIPFHSQELIIDLHQLLLSRNYFNWITGLFSLLKPLIQSIAKATRPVRWHIPLISGGGFTATLRTKRRMRIDIHFVIRVAVDSKNICK